MTNYFDHNSAFKKDIKMRKMLLCLICLAFVVIGCGTDVKPTGFLNMLKNESNADRLSECLVEPPDIEPDTITFKANIPCLADLSKHEVSDTPDFTDVVAYPNEYFGRIITFSAVINDLFIGYPEFYTGRDDLRFIIDRYESGDLDDLELNIGDNYTFKCKIYNIYRNNRHSWKTWTVNAELISPPILVEPNTDEVE